MQLSEFICQKWYSRKRWKRDVSVILEKTPGNFLVEKLRAMLLIKEDCNAIRNINFNGRLMPNLETFSTTPQVIIGVEDHKLLHTYV